MQTALAVLALLGLTCSIYSIPLPNVGGRVNEVRGALEHIQKVRSALRRSLHLREAEEKSKARSAVRELELLGEYKREYGGGFLSNTLDTIKKSAEIAKRHIEKRNNDNNRILREKEILRKAADNIKRAAETIKRKRDDEASKRSCGIGLGFCGPEVESEKREDNKVFRSIADNVREAVDNIKDKRNQGGFLSNAMNAIQKSAEVAKRYVELQRRSNDEKRALNDVVDRLRKTVDDMKHKREEEDAKRESAGFLQNAMNAIKKSADRAKRHAGLQKEEASKRSCGIGLGFCSPEVESEKREDNRVFRSIADNVRKAVDNIKHKRNHGGFLSNAMNAIQKSAEVAKRHVELQKRNDEEASKRACGVGFGFCSPEKETKKREGDDATIAKIAKNFRRAADALNKKREQAKMRKREEEGRVFRDVADQIKKAASSIKQRRDQTKRAVENVGDAFKKIATRHVSFGKREEDMKVVRSVADNIKKAVDNIKQKRDEGMKDLLDEIMKRSAEEQKRKDLLEVFRRHPVAASLSAIKGMEKKSSTAEEDWKRKLREDSDSIAKRSRYMKKVGVSWNSKYHPSGSL